MHDSVTLMTTRRIIVCADDAGWSEDTDEVIRRLAERGNISAISLLTDGYNAHQWRGYELPQSCSLGLHFQLTWDKDFGSRGLGQLIIKAIRGALSESWLRERMCAQLQQFEGQTGRTPAFIDGHQHVHMLNQVRNVLVDCLAQRYGVDQQPAVRAPWSSQWRGLKAFVVNALGAGRLRRLLNQHEIPANSDFAGIYALSDGVDYRALMQSWLSSIKHGGLIMCHPGGPDIAEHAGARSQEADYFCSAAWQNDLSESDTQLIPFTRSSVLGL